MRVEVVLTEADIAQEFAEAVEARDLPEKFFFWFPRSAAAWATLIRDVELYGGLNETGRPIAGEFGALTRAFDRRLPGISFGRRGGLLGQGLIGPIKDAGAECLHFPVYSNHALVA